jgi:long-subunit fatty acid transport protein
MMKKKIWLRMIMWRMNKNPAAHTGAAAGKVMLFLVMILLAGFNSVAAVKPLYTYYNTFYGARSLSLGNAFTAVADDLTAVYRNPAGIAEFSGPQFYLNYRWDKLNYEYSPQEYDSSSGLQSYTYDFSSTLRNVDFISLAVPVYFWDINWNFAFSYYRYFPYGIEGQLREHVLSGSGSTDSLTTLTLSGSSGIDVLGFTSAFYLTDYFSFGITLQQFFKSGEITYGLTSSTEVYTQTSSDRIKGRNLVLGLMGKLTRDIILGITYQTRFTDTLESQYTRQDTVSGVTSSGSTEAEIRMPAQLAVGLVLKPYAFMRLSFEYSIFYWSDTRLSGYYESTQDLEFPVKGDFSFSQKDTVNYRMGVEFNIPLERAVVFIRGGLFKDQQLFVDGAASPAPVKLKGYAVGLGIDISSQFRLDAGYMRQKGTWDEAGYFDPVNTTVSTRYKSDIFSVSFSYSFGKKKE